MERDVMGTVQRSQLESARSSKAVEQRARTIIETHPLFVGRPQLFEFQFNDDILILRGSVPTFYLKQILQSVLKNLDGIRRIDNQVTVDWNDGLIGSTRN
jgi:hypothetical protein